MGVARLFSTGSSAVISLLVTLYCCPFPPRKCSPREVTSAVRIKGVTDEFEGLSLGRSLVKTLSIDLHSVAVVTPIAASLSSKLGLRK